MSRKKRSGKKMRRKQMNGLMERVVGLERMIRENSHSDYAEFKHIIDCARMDALAGDVRGVQEAIDHVLEHTY